MNPIRIAQIGMGPLGRRITQFILERPNLALAAAVDLDPALEGRDPGELAGTRPAGIRIVSSLEAALGSGTVEVAVLTTVSDMERITPQIEAIVARGVPVVTTCEELSYPWDTRPDLAQRIDRAAKTGGAAVLATGVNPGFLMDTLPLTLTAVCRRVDTVKVTRIQDASKRRLPFQKKIGAGLTPAEFEAKRKAGTLRHVGLTESMQMIASRLGWKLDRTEDILTPVTAGRSIVTEAFTIEPGMAAGVQQIGRGFVNGTERITLVFRASVGAPVSEDTVEIQGDPVIRSTIPGGVNGDTATCAIVLNAIPQVLGASPGLHTMADISLVSYHGEPSA